METLNSKEMIKKTIDSNDIVLIYFGNSRCGVCLDMRPKVENMLKKYGKIKGIYVDMEGSKEIVADYSIFTMPAILVLIEGKETIREARHISILDVDNKIARYYNFFYNKSE